MAPRGNYAPAYSTEKLPLLSATGLRQVSVKPFRPGYNLLDLVGESREVSLLEVRTNYSPIRSGERHEKIVFPGLLRRCLARST